MGDAGGTGIAGPAIGFGGRVGREVGGEERMQAGRRVIGELAQPDAAGTAVAGLRPRQRRRPHFAPDGLRRPPPVIGSFLLRRSRLPRPQPLAAWPRLMKPKSFRSSRATEKGYVRDVFYHKPARPVTTFVLPDAEG